MATTTQVQFKVTTNAADVGKWLSGQSKKILQAGKTALSKTILQIQEAERRDLLRAVQVRKKPFMRNRVKITRFPKATADGLVAVIGINNQVQGTPLFLAGLEDTSTPRKPLSGNAVAVPITGTGARTAFTKNVPASLRINRLQLTQKGGGYKGNKRTFIVQGKGGTRVVYQRTGKGKNSKTSALYVFKKDVKLKRRLRFIPIARDLAEQQLPRLYTRYLRLYLK